MTFEQTEEMSRAAGFCTKCGSRLREPAGFCSACGAAVTSSPPSERILAGFSGLLKKGRLGLGRSTVIVVLTDRRLLLAQLTGEMLKQAAREASQAADQAGKGFFGKIGAQMKVVGALEREYLSLTPEQILERNPENLAIERAEIKKIKVKTGRAPDENTAASPDELKVEAGGRKFAIELNQGAGGVKKLLREHGLM